MFAAAFVDHLNLALIGASEKVVPVQALSACAFVDSSVNSPDTTVLVPVPVTWGCNELVAGYSALVSLHQIDEGQQLGQQPANLRGTAAKEHPVGLEQVSLWQVDWYPQPQIWGMVTVFLGTWVDFEV